MKSKNTMRGARLEPDSGYVQYLDACAAFLSRANHVLEEITAFDELEELARHDSAGDRAAIEAWARTWGVNAPCMRQAAQDIVHATRRDPANSGFRHESRSEPMGERWRRQLGAWNEFPVTMSADDGVASGTMSVPDPLDPRVGSFIEAPLEQLLEQPHILGPIATNPRSEPRAQFLERARHHWEARRQVGIRAYGLTPVAVKPDLLDQVDWLVRYQIQKTPFEVIASDLTVTPDGVRKAVHRLAALLDLERRPAPRGRPPHAVEQNPDK